MVYRHNSGMSINLLGYLANLFMPHFFSNEIAIKNTITLKAYCGD